MLPLEGGRKPVVLLNTQFNEGGASFSPDGRWVSYTSAESGRAEIYVRPFNASGPSLGEGKWQVSRDGGTSAKWRNDGKEIYFRVGEAPFAAEINATGSAFQSGTPKRLFDAPFNGNWDVTGDGKRFLMTVAPKQQNGQTPITVILNWQADLQK